VKDFDHWKSVFDANLEPPRAAGPTLSHVWRSIDDPNDVFSLFEVEDRGRAESFMQAPESAATGVEAGVIGTEGTFSAGTRRGYDQATLVPIVRRLTIEPRTGLFARKEPRR